MVKFVARNEGFDCIGCGMKVEPIRYGGGYRNHCFRCLASRHMDGPVPGDRASRCEGKMPAVGLFYKRTGEQVLIHKCVRCGLVRYNRVAADDDEEAILKLTTQPVPENYLPSKKRRKNAVDR